MNSIRLYSGSNSWLLVSTLIENAMRMDFSDKEDEIIGMSCLYSI